MLQRYIQTMIPWVAQLFGFVGMGSKMINPPPVE
ncbi:hypothetical protein RHDE110596_04500 [Prescottella defluvii]